MIFFPFNKIKTHRKRFQQLECTVAYPQET